MDPAELAREVAQVVQGQLMEQLDVLVVSRLKEFEGNLTSKSESQFAKMQSELAAGESHKFAKKSCEDQFRFNCKVQSKLLEANHALTTVPATDEGTAKARQKISEGEDLLMQRQKIIKIADTSEHGWKVVEEYTANPLADDSDDEKRITRAQARAERKAKSSSSRLGKWTSSRGRRFAPYASTTRFDQPGTSRFYGSTGGDRTGAWKPGTCYACGKAGHWRAQCDRLHEARATTGNQAKLSENCNLAWEQGVKVFQDEKLLFACNKGSTATSIVAGGLTSPVGRLKDCLPVWKEAGASEFVTGVIEEGYKLPFREIPPMAEFKNNGSALKHGSFVSVEIDRLQELGCITEVNDKPVVVNPLTVALNKANKPRLVLDCSRHVNLFLHKFKFQYEDARVARSMFQVKDYVFTYDLKAAYHHLEIFSLHRCYLGFAWDVPDEKDGDGKIKRRFYVFNVLPFGISVAGFIFSKVLREVVKYWRSCGRSVIMFLDDGLAGASDYESACRLSSQIQSDLRRFGFLLADDKCDWQPKQTAVWLGYRWDFEHGKIHVKSERIEKLLVSLSELERKLIQSGWIKVKDLANVAGQIISMQTVFGGMSRLRTRDMYACIGTRSSWRAYVLVSKEACAEARFWLENVVGYNLEGCELIQQTMCTESVCSDASSVGFGGFWSAREDPDKERGQGSSGGSTADDLVQLVDLKHVLGQWSRLECEKSSTWRELEGASRVVRSLIGLQGKAVDLVMDSKNACQIVRVGSRVPELQDISLQLNEFCVNSSVKLFPRWIPREHNGVADFLSRCSDSDDWGVQFWVFKKLDQLWGPHSVDRFATDYNAKCARFNSRWWCPGTEAIDAFSQKWVHENNWCVPPPRLGAACVSKLCDEKAHGTLVVPVWKSAPFWALLVTEKGQFKSFVSEALFLKGQSLCEKGRGNNGIFVKKNTCLEMVALKIAF